MHKMGPVWLNTVQLLSVMIPQGTTKSVDYGSIIQLYIIFVMIGSAYVLQYFNICSFRKVGRVRLLEI